MLERAVLRGGPPEHNGGALAQAWVRQARASGTTPITSPWPVQDSSSRSKRAVARKGVLLSDPINEQHAHQVLETVAALPTLDLTALTEIAHSPQAVLALVQSAQALGQFTLLVDPQAGHLPRSGNPLDAFVLPNGVELQQAHRLLDQAALIYQLAQPSSGVEALALRDAPDLAAAQLHMRAEFVEGWYRRELTQAIAEGRIFVAVPPLSYEVSGDPYSAIQSTDPVNWVVLYAVLDERALEHWKVQNAGETVPDQLTLRQVYVRELYEAPIREQLFSTGLTEAQHRMRSEAEAELTHALAEWDRKMHRGQSMGGMYVGIRKPQEVSDYALQERRLLAFKHSPQEIRFTGSALTGVAGMTVLELANSAYMQTVLHSHEVDGHSLAAAVEETAKGFFSAQDRLRIVTQWLNERSISTEFRFGSMLHAMASVVKERTGRQYTESEIAPLFTALKALADTQQTYA